MRSATKLGPLRPVSAGMLILLVGATVAGTFGLRSVVADQQRRLLAEKTTEAGYVVQSVFSAPTASLASLAQGAGTSAGFALAAKAALASASQVGEVRDTGGTLAVVYSAGTAPTAGSAVTGPLAALLTRALSAGGQVSGVVADGRSSRLVFAQKADPGTVVYQDDPGLQPGTLLSGQDLGPFSQLDGVLYASDRPDPQTLVFATTRHLPLGGQVERQSVGIGSDQWLIETSSRNALTGTVAADAPWAMLVVGLAGAVLLTMLVEMLARRKAYAEALVDERTGELRAALDERSKLEQAERQARKVAEAASSSKNEFLSRMSHELRTPLNAVLGFGQLLEMDPLEDTERESVDHILKAGRHLLALINDVLDISRIESGRLSLSPEPVHIAQLVDEALDLLRPLARTLDVRVEAQIDDGRHIHADRQRLKQVLLNLVSNAVKYNRRGGSVHVGWATTDDGQLEIAVTDTGLGISSDDLDRLFVPFERLGAERSDVEGTGIGLALSRHLVEAMGGTIGIDSAEGQGSRFWLQLPAADDPLDAHPSPPPAPDKDSPADHHPGRRQVLHIEDNLSNLTLVERIFQRRADIELTAAMQGRLGVTLARQHHPDLILLDLHLPDLDGTEVLRELKQDPATAAIPVVIISADATPGQIERLLTHGVAAYLTKPLDVEQLLSIVDAHLTPLTSAPPV